MEQKWERTTKNIVKNAIGAKSIWIHGSHSDINSFYITNKRQATNGNWKLDNENIIEKNDAPSCYIMITMTQNFHLQRELSLSLSLAHSYNRIISFHFSRFSLTSTILPFI